MDKDKRHPNLVMIMAFDRPVYSDAGMTEESKGPFETPCSTKLPKDLYFKDGEYTATVKTKSDRDLYKITFTYPEDVDDGVLLKGSVLETTFKLGW